MFDVAAIDEGLRGGGGFVVGGGGFVVIFCSGFIGTTGFSGFSVDRMGGQIRFSNLTTEAEGGVFSGSVVGMGWMGVGATAAAAGSAADCGCSQILSKLEIDPVLFRFSSLSSASEPSAKNSALKLSFDCVS